MNKIKVLVVKDDEGVLRPMAGIWLDNQAGAISKESYLEKNSKHGDTVVEAELTENE